LLIAMFDWVVSPQICYLQAAERYSWMVDNASQRSSSIVENMNAKNAELEKLKEEVEQIQNSFFTEEKANEFFSDLEPICLLSDCNIESLTFMPPENIATEENELYTTSITLKRAIVSFSGSYENIIKFHKKLSEYSQQISIEKLSIQSIPYSDKFLSVVMTLKIYQVNDKEINSDE
ncbi:MAG: type 4a pilus biogenesis protein PilO, partial [Sedimentisphaerales bacterium]|nr:type 4a pilus biogenesis protein PilO [Sedimentisphaerales bacterium]